MSGEVRILDAHGQPVRIQRRRPLALNGNSNVPFDAASRSSQHMAAWNPTLWSADTGMNPYRDTIVARVRDAVANDGWASGAVTRILDNAIGANLKPISKPDWMWLQQETGNKGFDHAWAREFGRAVDSHWRTWANDPGFWCDITRNQTFSQMAHTSFRHVLVDGDAIAILPWAPERVGRGRARYCTAVQLIDPDRLSNPNLVFDQQSLRGGCEIDGYGATVAYHIREAHQNDWWAGAASMTWKRVPRETDWGRPYVVHSFEQQRAGQHRGGAGIFAPVLERLKMLIKYDGTELDAAIINAIFAAYVESPMDPQLVKEAMGGGEGDIDREFSLNGYQQDRMAWGEENALVLGGARIPHLYPGEAIRTVTAARPSSNYAPFQAAALRNIAAGLGLSAQQLSNDWSDVNYSSARAAMLEAHKTLTRRQTNFFVSWATPIRSALLEEMMEVDGLPLPGGVVPEFMDARAAYVRCQWAGPPRGWINPVDERAGAILGMDSGLSTLEQETFAQGDDWEELLHQRAEEIRTMDELKIPRPEWVGQQVASIVSRPPQKPEAA
ncbi:phage portal protein [Rhizosaccharibacter radicis]|uniref:Phage portal protein n=1 Tax=Rhizosaccharibacter radicis TaxID=2782605 RepID=A0ABT1VW11_9PROT|nr:phage portal protein [Acetobacteraceae bacterium KSS12]